MSNFMERHAIAIAVLVFMLLALTLVFAPRVHGQADWDKSTLVATGQCLASGALRVTVTNGGQDMQGPVDYGWAVGITNGTLQLKAGESITLDSPAQPGVKIEFWVNQRPGHEGTGIVWVRMTCTPTAVTLASFTAGGTCVRTPYCYIVNARWSWISFDMALCKRLQRPIYYRMVCR
jgi:hypothetical protein